MIKISPNYSLTIMSIIIGIVLGFSPIGKLKLFPLFVGSMIGIKFLTK